MSFKQFFTSKNAETFSKAVINSGIPKNAILVKMEQVHGCEIKQVEEIEKTETDSRPAALEINEVDACYTSQKNTFLSVKTADCLPILIHGFRNQLKQEFVAAAHAGRKSTQQKILYKLLEELDSEYNFVKKLKEKQTVSGLKIKKSDVLYIWFGPAICVDCYQIDKKTNLHFDLIEENKKQLFDFFKKNNLNPKKSLNLKIEKHCTLHENEKYYSYRATGPGVKMNYSFIGII